MKQNCNEQKPNKAGNPTRYLVTNLYEQFKSLQIKKFLLMSSSILFILIFASLMWIYYSHSNGQFRKAIKPVIHDDFSDRLLCNASRDKGEFIKNCNQIPNQITVTTVNNGQLEIDKKNVNKATTSLHMDISQQKKLEDALRISEKKYQNLFEKTNDAIVMTNVDTGIIFEVNKKAGELLGMSTEEIIGLHYTDLQPNANQKLCPQIFSPNIKKPEKPRENIFVCHKEGRKIPVEVNSNIVDLGDKKIMLSVLKDITDQKKIEGKLKLLEKEVIEISRKERQQIQQDLHDVLAQHLTGIAFMNKALEQKLAAKSLVEASDAAKIVKYNNEAISEVRKIMKALNPISNDPEGFMLAIQELAHDENEANGICCRFVCKKPVLHYDDATATHLFCIAQKSIHNATKFGKAKNVLIKLTSIHDKLTLSIQNDGLDLRGELKKNKNLGLDIMIFRAKIIGALFTIKRNLKGETTTIVHFKQNPWREKRNLS
ncbi:MAG: PAS domain S-box protein [bacterium]